MGRSRFGRRIAPVGLLVILLSAAPAILDRVVEHGRLGAGLVNSQAFADQVPPHDPQTTPLEPAQAPDREPGQAPDREPGQAPDREPNPDSERESVPPDDEPQAELQGPDEQALTQADGGDKAERPWSIGVPMSAREAAREAFHDGNRLLQVPLFDEAAQRYRAAIELWPHPAFYFNLTISLINLVQPVEAFASLERAMAYGSEGLGAANYQQAQRYHEQLKARLVTLVVRCDQAGAEIRIDGQFLFRGPGHREHIVLPGEHQLVAELAGYSTATRSLTLTAGQTLEVDLVLERPPETKTERYLPAWIPWATTATGLAVVAGALTIDRQANADIERFGQVFSDTCLRGCDPVDEPDIKHQLDSARRLRTNAIRLYVAGGALTAAGITLLFFNRERLIKPTLDTVSLTPLLAPEAAGVNARLVF